MRRREQRCKTRARISSRKLYEREVAEAEMRTIRRCERSDDANRRTVFAVVNQAAVRMTFKNMALKCRAPQVMSISRIQVLGGRIHDQEFIAERALPSNSANLSEECEVIRHETSISRWLQMRNLPWSLRIGYFRIS